MATVDLSDCKSSPGKPSSSTCDSSVGQVHPGPTHGHLLAATAGAAHTHERNLSWRGDSLVLLLLGALEG